MINYSIPYYWPKSSESPIFLTPLPLTILRFCGVELIFNVFKVLNIGYCEISGRPEQTHGTKSKIESQRYYLPPSDVIGSSYRTWCTRTDNTCSLRALSRAWSDNIVHSCHVREGHILNTLNTLNKSMLSMSIESTLGGDRSRIYL